MMHYHPHWIACVHSVEGPPVGPTIQNWVRCCISAARLVPSVCGMTFVLLTGPGLAAPISIIDPQNPASPFQIINQYGVSGPSSWGGPGSSGIVTGFGFVDPGGKDSETTGFAEQNGTVIPLTFSPVFEGDKSYFGYTSDLSLTGPWTLTLQNGPDSLTVQSPSIDTSNLAPMITGVKAANLGSVTPTFSWDDPGGDDVNVDVVIYDLTKFFEANGAPVAIFFDFVPKGETSYTIPDGILDPDGFYSFSVRSSVLRTEEDVSDFDGTSLAGSYESGNERFFDFVTGDIGNIPEAYLPQVDTSTGEPVFIFDNLVSAGIVELYDPLVAIGYDFSIGSGNPLFESVTLPFLGDGIFELFLKDGESFTFADYLSAGDKYFFGPNGVSEFRVLGLEPQVGVSPLDNTAFVVGLSFVDDGHFTGTMKPITIDYQAPAPVPLPATGLLLTAGLVGLLVMRRQRGSLSSAPPTS